MVGLGKDIASAPHWRVVKIVETRDICSCVELAEVESRARLREVK